MFLSLNVHWQTGGRLWKTIKFNGFSQGDCIRVRDRHQIPLLILSEFERVIVINFCSPRNHQKTMVFWRFQGKYNLINSIKFAYSWSKICQGVSLWKKIAVFFICLWFKLERREYPYIHLRLTNMTFVRREYLY